jgi:uncharacterized protein (DUF2384 family)
MGCELPVLAKRVLGSEERARAWIKSPNASLGHRVPEELAETLDGFQEALAELESLGPDR